MLAATSQRLKGSPHIKSARRRRCHQLVGSVSDGVSWHWTRLMHVAFDRFSFTIRIANAAVRWPVESLGVHLSGRHLSGHQGCGTLE